MGQDREHRWYKEDSNANIRDASVVSEKPGQLGKKVRKKVADIIDKIFTC